jgi:hypothetical protein
MQARILRVVDCRGHVRGSFPRPQFNESAARSASHQVDTEGQVLGVRKAHESHPEPVIPQSRRPPELDQGFNRKLRIEHRVEPHQLFPAGESFPCVVHRLAGDGSGAPRQARQLWSWPDAQLRFPGKLRFQPGRRRSRSRTVSTSPSIRSLARRPRCVWPSTRTGRP